jgi:catechol 2,3-dioxygenase-like lactoylglutathione lyase family enzyme
MQQHIACIALLVDDYDQAINFYTRKLGFTLTEDTPLSTSKRWVLVTPAGSSGPALLLAKAATEEQHSRVGNQTGGRVFLLLHTDDLDRDYRHLLQQDIRVIEGPRQELYGKVLVFEDLYGNKWDLIEKKI